jgi:catechol 2,3-dioxygenase-like lactoylglutathione lyase family enzyme
MRRKASCRNPIDATSLSERAVGEDSLYSKDTPMPDWFARPVFHVTDVEASLRFYVDQLGFTSPWRFDENGKVFVAQVERQGCAIILSSQWPEKIGKGLLFISLNVEPPTPEAAIAALDDLRAELEAKGAPVKEGSWGYRLLVVDDPDGNQLFFNYPK